MDTTSRMRGYQRIRTFFFPGPGASRWRRVLPYLAVTLIVAAASLFTVFSWRYTNSNEFCGTVCHDIMYPYLATYQQSTHTRVNCVECHMGRDALREQLPRKMTHAAELFALITGSYEQPLIARRLYPARITCELCHYPPQFFDDTVREIRRYADDRENTPISTWFIVKTGGGLRREGLGYGIHWHVENQVFYYATDESRQTIPYMRVVDAEGNVTEYADVEFQPPEGFPSPQDLRQMDCMDCHNRTGHPLWSPEEIVDSALKQGLIPQNIPYIRKEAVDLLRVSYTTTDETLRAIDGLEARYAQQYPPAYQAFRDEIRTAIQVLKDLYRRNFFPEQGVNWSVYPDNLGHKDWPGCFRCHDGRHVSPEGEVVRIECNLCHSIPVVVRGGGGATISLSRGPEPSSHMSSAWLHQHYLALDETCALCHTTSNPGGSDDSSFCANSACHGIRWTYADLDAPALAERLGFQRPTPTPVPTPVGELPTYASAIGPLLAQRCGACHGQAAGLDVTSYRSLMAGSRSGPVVVPGDPEKSRILQVLQEGHFASLSAEEKDLLRAWIASGAPEQ